MQNAVARNTGHSGVSKFGLAIRPANRSFCSAHRAEIAKLAETFRSHYTQPTANNISEYIEQFETSECKDLVLGILKNVDYFDDARMNEIFSEYYDGLDPQKKAKTIVTTLGGPQDSSITIVYELSKIISQESVKPIWSLPDAIKLYAPTDVTLLFVDDFIGSGGNAVHRFSEWLGISPPKHVAPLNSSGVKWLRKVDLRYFAFVACAEGITRLTSFLSEHKIKLTVNPAILTQDTQGCFKRASRVFHDQRTTALAREMARSIGYQLLKDDVRLEEDKCEKFALGYRDSQKLLVFQRNTPTSTLPILWKNGLWHGKRWEPLFPRRP